MESEIEYTGTSFSQKIQKCSCGKPATLVKANVYFGELMNTKTGEKYLECDFEYFCKQHES